MNNYNTVYQNNGFILCYKSARKNAKTSDIIYINHLINHDKTDHKISDDKILDQFISTMDKIIYYSKQFKHLELSCYVNIFQQVEYKDANNEIYHDAEKHRYAFQRVTFYSIESCINYVFNL